MVIGMLKGYVKKIDKFIFWSVLFFDCDRILISLNVWVIFSLGGV